MDENWGWWPTQEQTNFLDRRFEFSDQKYFKIAMS